MTWATSSYSYLLRLPAGISTTTSMTAGNSVRGCMSAVYGPEGAIDSQRMDATDALDAIRTVRVIRRYRPEPLTERRAARHRRRSTQDRLVEEHAALGLRHHPRPGVTAAPAPARRSTPSTCPAPARAIALVVAAPDPEHARSVLWDLGRAAQNIILAAWAMGIGSCPITVQDFGLGRGRAGAAAMTDNASTSSRWAGRPTPGT